MNKSDMLIKIGNNYFINLELNFKHQKNVLYRNMIQLFKICGQVTESGMTDKELSLKKIGQLNFNTFSNINNKEIHKGFYSDEDGRKINDLLTFWNIDIVKCYKTVYNNIEDVQKLPKTVRWGAILYSDINNIEDTLNRIGDDLLSMEDKEKLVGRINNVKNNKKIIQEWMVIENNRLREEDILNTAIEDGFQEGLEKGIENNTIDVIKRMLEEGIDYSVISKVTGKTTDEIKEIENKMYKD